MAITDWPENERPRERLLALGPQALSDAELLAIFLRVGIKGKSAVDLARDLLARVDGSLARLAETPPKDLAKLPGLGPAKATQLAATLELARRALTEDMKTRDLFSSPGVARDWLKLKIGALNHEVFGALWLDAQTLSRHAHTNQRLSSRSGKAGARPQRRCSDPRPQSPIRPGRAVGRGRSPDPRTEGFAGTGGCARPRPLHRRRAVHPALVRGARPDLKKCLKNRLLSGYSARLY